MKNTTLITIAIFFIMNNLFGQNHNLKMHEIKDPNTGMVATHIPLPANWKVTPSMLYGPNGTEAMDYQGQRASAQHTIDDIINNVLVPNLQQNNIRVNNIINLRSIAENDDRVASQYWQVAPMQRSHQAKGLEFTSPDGKLGIMVVHFSKTQSQYHASGFYYLSCLVANPSEYPKAKKHYIYALANMKPTQQAINLHNQKEQAKANQSWANFNARNRANQRNNENFQKTQRDLSSVNDIYFDTYKNTSRMNDVGHSNTVNNVWEREARTNPYNGGQTHVNQNYKYYYMNQYGQYFGTNDPNYNPATDPNMYQYEWKRMQQPKGNY